VTSICGGQQDKLCKPHLYRAKCKVTIGDMERKAKFGMMQVAAYHDAKKFAGLARVSVDLMYYTL